MERTTPSEGSSRSASTNSQMSRLSLPSSERSQRRDWSSSRGSASNTALRALSRRVGKRQSSRSRPREGSGQNNLQGLPTDIQGQAGPQDMHAHGYTHQHRDI